MEDEQVVARATGDVVIAGAARTPIGSFNGALVYVGVHAFIAALCYLVVVGDKKGRVGYGFGKANDVSEAIRKSVDRAKRNMIKVPVTSTRYWAAFTKALATMFKRPPFAVAPGPGWIRLRHRRRRGRGRPGGRLAGEACPTAGLDQ